MKPFDSISRFLASYGLACVLLVILFLLTLFGTLEQTEHGLYEVQKKYFNAWWLVHWLGPVPIPLPAGKPVMMVLALNLLFGGLIRIRKSWKTAGVIVVHVGIAFLLFAGSIKYYFSVEGHLRLDPGERSDDYVSTRLWEVAIHDATDLVDVDEFLIPEEHFMHLTGDRTGTFRSEELPFEIELFGFEKNCRALQKGPMWDTPHPVVDGFALKPVPLEEEYEYNIAGVNIRVKDPDGAAGEQQGILWGVERFPWIFEAGGRTWAATLRHTRYRMPFEIQLEEFTRVLHPGMGMAKEFKSDVKKISTEGQQTVRIEMNKPLRHEGLVLFQTNWGPQDGSPPPYYSVFTVVDNPSDHWEKYALYWLITPGLALAFITKLVSFLRGQVKLRARDAAQEAA